MPTNLRRLVVGDVHPAGTHRRSPRETRRPCPKRPGAPPVVGLMLPRLHPHARFGSPPRLAIARRVRLRRPLAGFSRLELLMVLAGMAILTAAMLPWAESTAHDAVVAAAQTVATDLAYARSLAVANNSSYVIHFEPDQNRYVLRHSGTGGPLDTLPDSIFRNANDPPDRHIVNLAELPGVGQPVTLAGVFLAGAGMESVDDIEFEHLGNTVQESHSVVLLTIGAGTGRRYALVVVNPVTGLATVHPYSENLPSDLPSQAVEGILQTLP